MLKYTLLKKISGIVICCLLFGLMISGCSSHETAQKRAAEKFEKWRILAENSKPVTPVPEKTAVEIQAAPEIDSQEPYRPRIPGHLTHSIPDNPQELPEMPVTIRMNKVPVPVLLKTLGRTANLNIMINESVSGLANIDIENVPWNQVFIGLLETYGLTYEWTGMILRVITIEDLNKKKALMEAETSYRQSKNEYSISLLEMERRKERHEPLTTRIIKIHYADLKALRQNLESYLITQVQEDAQKEKTANAAPIKTPHMRGAILIDEFTNSLIIQATVADINKLLPIINELDRPIRQVRIEAHIVEANSDVAKELGVRWGGLGLAERGRDKRLWIGGDMSETGESLYDNSGNAAFANPTDGTIVNLPITATTPAKGLALGIMAESLGDFRLYAQLSALQEQGELNILSKPSITTMDHRKAIIKSGKEVPFQTLSADGNIQVEFKEAVIKLEVVPHIINEKIIRLEILTHKDELDWTNTVNGNPTIITKNAETRVTLLDGQTTVIAGLNKEKTSDSKDGVPGLQDIPMLGWLFKSTGSSSDMEELLIFITPHILKEDTGGKTMMSN